jgi:RNA polymerase sigma-70 factor (ECF subfamily)
MTDTLDLKQLRDAIDRAIAELPEQMRKIFELNRHDGLKYTEIATRLNLSIKTVETQMSRALLKLRQKLAAFIR